MITIVAVLVAGIVLGYAARQRQDLLAAEGKIDALTTENEDLRRDNIDLQKDAAAHVSTIEMVLREVEGSS